MLETVERHVISFVNDESEIDVIVFSKQKDGIRIDVGNHSVTIKEEDLIEAVKRLKS